jgi:type IV secretory pathway TrbD component
MDQPQVAPDPAALRRRVLLTGLLTLALFLVVAYVVSSAGASDWWLVIAMVAVYGAVIRPLMAPVRNASRLRRSLAYQAFLDRKEDDS